MIVHLCVDPAFRGQGLARLLVSAVRDRSIGSHEIQLRCRRDFDANRLWPKLGFLAVGEESGRATGAMLTVWRYELAQLPLLEAMFKNVPSRTVPVVIDANVFFDLDECQGGSTESLGLIADWMQEFVELCVTGEILNEIARCEDHAERTRQRARASRYRQLIRDVSAEALAIIEGLLPRNARQSTASDARQLAMTVASGVRFFVTRDSYLLNIADEMDEHFGVTILSPHEIIGRFDELRREEVYRPRHIFLGPGARTTVARAEDIDRIVTLLHQGQHVSEPRRQTAGRLKEMIALPARFTVSLVERGGDILAAYVIDASDGVVLRVPYFAVSATTLGQTAAHHYTENLVALAIKQGSRLVAVSEAVRADEALREAGFWQEPGFGWLKLALPFSSDASGIAAEVEKLGQTCSMVTASAERIATELRSQVSQGRDSAELHGDLVALERVLWPAKISDTGLPCFVVPIQPRWAKELFDRERAEGTLFGANPQLVLNAENAYYRSARPQVLAAPGRVLWYVSLDRSYPGSMAIRACSYVDEVIVAPAKDLFRRFRRLGVYEWADVVQLAQGDPFSDIMAFRFSKTELFARPISWDETQGLLEQHSGRRSQFQAPLMVSETCFLDIYHRGASSTEHAP